MYINGKNGGELLKELMVEQNARQRTKMLSSMKSLYHRPNETRLVTRETKRNALEMKRWCVSCMLVLQRGHSGDGCDLASNMCKYDLRKGDLFVLSWPRVRRVRLGSISSELLMSGRGVRSILL